MGQTTFHLITVRTAWEVLKVTADVTKRKWAKRNFWRPCRQKVSESRWKENVGTHHIAGVGNEESGMKHFIKPYSIIHAYDG